LDEKIIERLLPDKISVYEIPLLSDSPPIHDMMSGIKFAFNRATLAIAKLKAARQVVVTAFVATRLNLPELEDTINLAHALGVDGIMFNRFNPGGVGYKSIDRLQPSPEELCRALDTADRMSADYGLPISCSIPLPPCLIDTTKYPNINFGFCALGTDNAYFTIDPYGNLRPCNHSPTILGNLRKHSFWDLVDSERMIQYLAAVPVICKACTHVSECKGCCRAAAESCFGSTEDPDPFVRKYAWAHGKTLQPQ
jgi:radical SAM protein with 4Fe4S-binding SPASM domain